VARTTALTGNDISEVQYGIASAFVGEGIDWRQEVVGRFVVERVVMPHCYSEAQASQGV
jgi:hypothetical protein